MLYTKYGETERVQLGETGARRWLSYYYDDNTRRLTRSIVDAEVPRPMQTDVHYTYDPAGNITSIADTPAAQPADVQCFRYDHLRRLTNAWTPGVASWDEDAGCSGDPVATGLEGPAPYWHSYTYDKTGNRLTETQHATTGDVERSYTYPTTGQPRPHTLTSVTTDTTQGTTLDTFGYDATGNTTSRSLAGEDEVLRWDAEGHLASVTKDAQSTTFIYDTNGQRLIRKDPTSVTLYLGNQELKLDRATNTVSATRYYTAGGDGPTIAVRQGPTLTWLASDHQATHDIAIGSTTNDVTRRRQLPFGAPRGDQPTVWPGDRGFVGGTNDASTGLTHLGAREYDPGLGRFLSVDPIMDLTDPQQIHGYTYSNNSAVTFSDATGLKMMEGDDGRSSDSHVCNDGNCDGPAAVPLPPSIAPDMPQRPKATKPSGVTNSKLNNILGHIYAEPGDANWIGNGKVSDALRNELRTGRATQGVYHGLSVSQDLGALVKLLEEDNKARVRGGAVLTMDEREIALREARELWSVLNENDSAGVMTRRINENPNDRTTFNQTMESINKKSVFGSISDAEYVRPNHRSPKMVQSKGPTTGGFMRGMGALSIMPTAVQIVRGPSPGATPAEAFVEGMCVFDAVGVCGMSVPTGPA